METVLNMLAILGFGRLDCPILKRFAEKVRAADTLGPSLRTLVLGSSHAEKGYRAGSREFNMGCDFQDLYTSFELYRRYADSPDLKTVVLFYSVFSPGHDTLMTRDAGNCVAFKVAAGIGYRDPAVAAAKGLPRLERIARRKAVRRLRKIPLDAIGNGNEVSYSTIYGGMSPAERALGHFKNNCRGNDMTQYVRYLADETHARGQELVVVIPPATSGYRAALPSANVLFRELHALRSEVTVIDLYESVEFTDNDFIDPDHLSLNGAEKLTGYVLRRKTGGEA